MTGLGGYCYIVWGIWLRHCLNNKQDDYKLHWPRLTTMPVVVRQQDKIHVRADGSTNGPTKKNL